MNIRLIRLLSTIVSLGICLSCIVILRSCKKPKPIKATRILAEQAYKEAKKESAQPRPDMMLKNTDLYLFGNDSLKSCQINAEESKLFPNNNEIECTNITCILTTNKNTIATLKAPKAYINNTNKSMFLPGSITGTYHPWTIENNDVFYDAQNHKIKANNLSIKSPTMLIQAKESTMYLSDELIIMKKDIFSTFFNTPHP